MKHKQLRINLLERCGSEPADLHAFISLKSQAQMDIYQRTSLRKRCTLMPIHAERIDYIHVPAWVTTSFPQHLPNKSKLREAWFSSILSDFSLQITCCLEYFVYFCIEIHLFRRDGHFCIFPLRPILAPISHNTPPAWNKESPTLRRPRARVLYKCIPTEQYNTMEPQLPATHKVSYSPGK